jgi:hypothetical protein
VKDITLKTELFEPIKTVFTSKFVTKTPDKVVLAVKSSKKYKDHSINLELDSNITTNKNWLSSSVNSGKFIYLLSQKNQLIDTLRFAITEKTKVHSLYTGMIVWNLPFNKHLQLGVYSQFKRH